MLSQKHKLAAVAIYDARVKLESIISDVRDDSMEDNKVTAELEDLVERLRTAENIIKYFFRPVQEGRLFGLSNGRFEINGNEISCGFPLEVFWEDENCWLSGRVEHNNGYYFYSYDMGHPMLYAGMKCRIRV